MENTENNQTNFQPGTQSGGTTNIQPASATQEQKITESVSAENVQSSSGSKKSLVLVVVEIVLVIVVIILAIIFFTRQKNGGQVNIFNNNQAATPIINNKTANLPDDNSEAKAPVAVNIPESSSDKPLSFVPAKPAEDLRMTLPVPAQSNIMTENDIPAGAIKLAGTVNGFEPKEFTVKAGEDIVLALTSKVDLPVVLTFYSPNMAAVSIGCGPRETRWVSFKAPNQAGEYIFKNDVIGHGGEMGKMIVK